MLTFDILEHLADAFVQSDLQYFTHSHTDGADEHIRVRYLVQGNFAMQTTGINPATFW